MLGASSCVVCVCVLCCFALLCCSAVFVVWLCWVGVGVFAFGLLVLLALCVSLLGCGVLGRVPFLPSGILPLFSARGWCVCVVCCFAVCAFELSHDE